MVKMSRMTGGLLDQAFNVDNDRGKEGECFLHLTLLLAIVKMRCRLPNMISPILLKEALLPMVLKLTLSLFLILFTSGALAQETQDSQDGETPQKGQTEPSSPALSPEELKAKKNLEKLKTRPKEYRVLVLGVQIFLGRFGYGTGPYTGTLDEKTQSALRAYQQYLGLPETGDLDYHTLKQLTEDNKTLDQPIPYLPKAAFRLEHWDKAIQVQGTWAHESALTVDAVQTTRIFCFKEEKECIESTAILLNETVPVLDVLTHVYSIKKWDDEELVTTPYDGEACTISILRINRKQQSVTRFAAYQQKEGICEKVQARDVQYKLMDGPQVYAKLKQEKAKDTQRILRVTE